MFKPCVIAVAAFLVVCAAAFVLFYEPGANGSKTESSDRPHDRPAGKIVEARIDPETDALANSTGRERLRPAAPALEICGHVVAASGESLSGISAHLAAGDGRIIASVSSGSDGTFALKADGEIPAMESGRPAVIVEGAWRYPVAVLITDQMIADHAGSKLDLGDLDLLPSGALQLAVSAVDFTPLSPVHLAFLDEKNLPLEPLSSGDSLTSLPEPVRGAMADLVNPRPFALFETPYPFHEGELDCIVPAGLLRLQAWNDQHPLVESDLVTLRRGETTRVALELAAAGSIAGVCVDRRETPLEGIRILAQPVLQEGPDDYTILDELTSRGEKGTTRCPAFNVKTDINGAFRLAPLLAGLRYEVWCSDKRFQIVDLSAETPLEDYLVPVGTQKLKFVLKGVPTLRLILCSEDGGDPGPGPGNAHVNIEAGSSGYTESFALQEFDSTLTLPLKDPIPDEEEASISVRVRWGRSGLGSAELVLPWCADSVCATVPISPGIVYDLGAVPFVLAQVTTQWNWNGKSVVDTVRRWGDEFSLPRWNYASSGYTYVLDRDPRSGRCSIVSRDAELDWAVFWESEFREALIVDVNLQDGVSNIAKRANLSNPGKIVTRPDEDSGLRPGAVIRGFVTAHHREICGDARIGQWGFELDTAPGAEPVVWPLNPCRYKLAPDPSVTLWRPEGLTYTVKISARDDEKGWSSRNLIEKTFTLNDTFVIPVAVP